MTPTEAVARAAIARQPDAPLLLEALGLTGPAPEPAATVPARDGERAWPGSEARRGIAAGLGASCVVGGVARPSERATCSRCGLERSTRAGRVTVLCKSCRDYAQGAGELAVWAVT